MTSGDPEDVDDARKGVIASGDAFRRAAVPATATALRTALERLVASEPEWYATLNDEARAAFREAAALAIERAAADLERRFAAEDIWLDPLTAPGLPRDPPAGWDEWLPEWLIDILRRLTPRRGRAPGELDDIGNRAWIALLAAAEPLDPVLEGFGLAPSEIPQIGGGNFGLSPKTAIELDPTGTLGRLWDLYRVAYLRYRAVAG